MEPRGAQARAWWYSPRDGRTALLGTFENRGTLALRPPGTPAEGNDWVLVLDDASRGYAPPGLRAG